MAKIRIKKPEGFDVNPKDYTAVLTKVMSVQRTMDKFQYIKWLVSISITVALLYNKIKYITGIIIKVPNRVLGYGSIDL